MRVLALSLFLLSSGSLRVCGSDDAPAPAAASGSVASNAEVGGTATAKISVSGPRIGGTKVAVGKHFVELVLHESGSVEALVSDASDALVSEGVKLSLVASAKGGEQVGGKLEFSQPRGRFEGRCTGKAGAKIELVPGAVDVSLDVGGAAATAKIADAVILHGPRLGGHVLVAGAYGAELLARTNGEVLAFVRDRGGAEVNGAAGLELSVKATARGGASEDIALRFDAARACFAGKAKAGVELVPGPLELSIKAGARAGVGRLERVSLLAEARHGGEIVLAGDLAAEIAVKGKEVSVFVLDAAGKASTDANLDVKVGLGADFAQELALRWELPCLCYRGSVAANLDASVQPIRVAIVADGKLAMGAATSLRAVVDARARAAGKVVADAELGAGVATAAEARAGLNANANAKLKAPEVKAHVGGVAAPKAAARVDVQVPKVEVKQKASAGTQAGGKAKASAGFSIGTK